MLGGQNFYIKGSKSRDVQDTDAANLTRNKKVKIEVVSENIFILEFVTPIDRRRTLMDGPWTFFSRSNDF